MPDVHIDKVKLRRIAGVIMLFAGSLSLVLCGAGLYALGVVYEDEHQDGPGRELVPAIFLAAIVAAIVAVIVAIGGVVLLLSRKQS